MIAKSVGTIDGDIIRLDAPLNLPDACRVELTIKPLDVHEHSWGDFMDDLEQLCRDEPIGSGGVQYSRDDLHERS